MKYDAFISYRRENGFLMAQVIHDRLEEKGLRCFLDLEELRSGQFDEKIYVAIQEAHSFILILPKNALNRCSNGDDWVRKEILAAVKYNKTIIPVMYDGFKWPRKWDERIPPEIRRLENTNGVSGTQEYLSAMIDKIISYMPDEINIPFSIEKFTFIENQNDYSCLKNATEIIFCARTGKRFLNGHINFIREMLNNGGKFTFITSEESDLICDDQDEHRYDRENSIRIVQSLKKMANDRVKCMLLNKAPNLSLVYIKTKSNEKYLEIKFNFQTRYKSKNPIIRINSNDPYFSVFYEELIGIIQNAEAI